MEHGNLWQHVRASIAALITARGANQCAFATSSAAVLPQDHGPDAAGPRILVLTSGLGYGHIRAAEAIRLALLQYAPGATVQVIDWWSLMNAGVAHATREMYLHLVQVHTELYERIYGLGERTWREILSSRKSPPPSVLKLFELLKTLHAAPEFAGPAGGRYVSDRALLSMFCTTSGDKLLLAGGVRAKLALLKWSWARLVRRMEQLLEDFRPDVIVSTQMIPAALVSAVKQSRGWSIPSVAVPTDFGVHDFWMQPGTNLYCLGHETIAELPREMTARQSVFTGFPLMPEFTLPIDPGEARRILGIKHDAPVVLILGGGLGLGVDVVADRLLQAAVPLQLLVLAGRNVRAGLKLKTLATQYPARVKVIEWTDRVDLFVRAADLVVGKPGGLSVAEVLACGRPLLATRSLRGQEGFNVRFLERHQAGLLLSDAQLVTHIEFLMTHPAELAAVQTRAWNLGRRDGAGQIAEQILGLAVREQRGAGHSAWQRG